jgi:hypothetical protein
MVRTFVHGSKLYASRVESVSAGFLALNVLLFSVSFACFAADEAESAPRSRISD